MFYKKIRKKYYVKKSPDISLLMDHTVCLNNCHFDVIEIIKLNSNENLSISKEIKDTCHNMLLQ
jgi:hypothetical protein